MTPQDEQSKRDALDKLLYELASSQDILKEESAKRDFYIKIEDIYHNDNDENFRHFYSDIFSLLTTIDGDPSIGDINVLAQNMAIIKDDYYEFKSKNGSDNSVDISKEITKLYDHINLDVGRLNYTKRNSDKTQSQLAAVDSLNAELKEKVEETKIHIDRIEKDLKTESERQLLQAQENKESQRKMQNEYITILGIFAAIVLAFTGGMTFTSSILENIHKSSIYRIILVSLIVGCILYNLIWLLIDFIRNINEKTIRKWWMLLLFNGLFLAMMIFTVFSYKFDWFSREEMISQSVSEVVIEEAIVEDAVESSNQ